MKQTVHVYRSGRTWGVYLQPATNGTGQELVEGGFFSRAAAVNAAEALRREHGRDQGTGEMRHGQRMVDYDRRKENR
jgi:hypothetical protein